MDVQVTLERALAIFQQQHLSDVLVIAELQRKIAELEAAPAVAASA